MRSPFLAVPLVGDEVVGWQDDGLAGESVAESVEAGTLFAGLGARAGGFLGVGAIYFGAICSEVFVCGNVRHNNSFLSLKYHPGWGAERWLGREVVEGIGANKKVLALLESGGAS
jgi:hypothetical protein